MIQLPSLERWALLPFWGFSTLTRLCLRRRSLKTPIFDNYRRKKRGILGSAEKKKSPKLGGLRRILPGGFLSPIFYYSPSHIHHEAPQQHTAGSAGLLRAAHPTPNTHTARARRVTGANVGSPGNSTELSLHETKYQILHITTTAVHLSYRLLYFKPSN